MNRAVTVIALLMPLLVCLWACSTGRHGADLPRTNTLTVTNGQVFLGDIGPFIKTSEGHYATPDTKGRGLHYLTRSEDGQWFYTWTWVKKPGVAVDASALQEK
jgi:hypothetical protein